MTRKDTPADGVSIRDAGALPTLDEIRVRVQERMLRILLIVGGIDLLIVCALDIYDGNYGNVAFYLGAFAFLILGLSLRIIPYIVRGGCAVIAIYAIGVFELWNFGTDSVGTLFLLSACFFSCVMLGTRAGIGTVVIAILTLIAIALLYTGFSHPPGEFVLVLGNFHRVWMPGILSLTLLGTLLIAFTSLLLTSLDKANKETVRLLLRLRDERNQLTAHAEEYRRAEEQLRQAQRMEAVGHLAGGVAHDFNNLMQAILGYTELTLSHMSPDEEHYHDLQQVHQAAERAATLTRQLLAFSRQQVILPKDINLNELVQRLLDMIRRLISESIEVVFEEGDAVCAVHADPGQMEQVIINLCVNARDAMPEGGILRIRSDNVRINEEAAARMPDATPGAYVCLAVSDSGTGMDTATRERIFDPFFTTKEVGKGTGLGLATVYGIVRQHGGFVNVSSVINDGSVFEVYLPAAASVEESSVTERRKISPRGGESVLIAEDEEIVLHLTTTMLEKAGYTVTPAKNGQEAVSLFEANQDSFDLVILDMVMPKLGGREALDRLHVLKPQLRCLFMSGYLPDSTLLNLEAHAGVTFIQKPFQSQAFLNKVREALDN